MDTTQHAAPEPRARAAIKLPQDRSDLERGLSLNNNPDPQLFVDETYPEGGLEAWLVVFGCFCGLVASLGLMNSIAVFQTYNAANQLSTYNEGTIGWIYSIYTFLAFGCGVYIGPLFDKYGPRWLLLPGTLGIVASLMILSVCTKYWHFILAFSLLNGLCTSLLFTPCFTAVGHFFKARRGLATGIASTGGGVGGVVFPLILQRLFVTVGWPWALRILGFVCLVLATTCSLLVHKRLPAARNASPHPDFRIFRDKAFLFTTLGVFLLEFGLFIPIAYISSYALHVGLGDDFSFYILTILNAASVFGRLLPGYWADVIGPFNSNMLSVFVTIVACFGVWLPAGHTLPGIVIFAVLFGFGTGSNISITPVCVGKLCHTQNYGRYYATCYTVVSFACLIGIPIGGSVVTACGGEYWGLIVFTGLTEVLSLISFQIAKVVSVGWSPWIKF
ncbi:major facilitator superfamily domain-containing protein [Truncatella angustata]|uniref:Major facilitator superfamily domain-containing protein n=1 Tax=Truncatella angustata TaxID=152316 RepID=A0A9P8RP40_9PEZI|nr:major facilitator superfamily domain-containing protein [Truncatella angustata]KAH6647040.1 major facilitator superfamily domain-containing protein [Truncatella angustata]